MSTIKLPKNMTFLTGHLPKPKYDDRKIDKRIRHTRTVCHIESETDSTLMLYTSAQAVGISE